MAGKGNVTKEDLTVLKSLAKPPELVKRELSVTALLLGLPENQAKEWRYVKSLLAKAELQNQLSSCDTSKIPRDVALQARDMMQGVQVEAVKKNQSTIDAVLGKTE